MYAIDCDLEQGLLVTYDSETYKTISAEIKQLLADYGFTASAGSIFLGRGNIDAVSAFRCIIALNELGKKYPQLSEILKTVRIMEIAENVSLDLTPPA